MKTVIGFIMIISGVALGVYLGLVVCFVGGIITIVDEFKSADTSALWIVWGLIKMGVAWFVGWVSAAMLIIPGAEIIGKE